VQAARRDFVIATAASSGYFNGPETSMVKVLVGLEQAVLFCPPEYGGHVEVQSAVPAVRRWPPRLCAGFEMSLLIGPSHDATIHGRRTITPGNITFVQLPGTVWSAERVYGAFLSIELSPDLFASLRESWVSARTLPGPSQVVMPELLGAFSRAHNAFRLNYDATTRTEALVDLIHQVLASMTGTEPVTPVCDAVSRARDALHESSYSAPTIDDLATHAGMTPFELVRSFHHRYGIGPSAYRRSLQIARARELLRRGRTIDEVTLELGFTSRSAMTRSFIAQVGVEPTRYAEQVTSQ
jgi:AraC-like DNA-binding protein